MKYVIMADGKGSRWHGYLGHSKHEIEFGGETLIERTVRLIRENDANARIIVTSHDEKLSTGGAERYEPKNNVLEIDRFTVELIGDDVCFLYGDVLYSEEAMHRICSDDGDAPILFFGSEKSICAVLIRSGDEFLRCFTAVRRLFTDGCISECKGWQVYRYYVGLPLDGRQIGESFVFVPDSTRDFNAPEDYDGFLAEKNNMEK